MNMLSRFDENPAMTLQVIKYTKRYGRTHAHIHARTDNVKTVYPPSNKVCGGIKIIEEGHKRIIPEMVPRVGLQCVIVVFPDHTYLLFGQTSPVKEEMPFKAIVDEA